MVDENKTLWDLKHEAYCSRLEYGRAETILAATYDSYQIYLYAQSNAIGDRAPSVWGITLRVCERDMAKVAALKSRMKITKNGKKALYVESLEVNSENRREGLATFLLKLLFLLAVLCDVDYICGEFCPRSSILPEIVERFYLNLGFKIDHSTNAMAHTEFIRFATPSNELLNPIPHTLRR